MILLNISNTTITNIPFYDFTAPNVWTKTQSTEHSLYIYFQARTQNPIPNFITQAENNAKLFLYELLKNFGINGYTDQMQQFINDYKNICNTFYNSFLSNKHLVDTAWVPYHYLYNYGINRVKFSFDFKMCYNKINTQLIKKENKHFRLQSNPNYETPNIYYTMNITENYSEQG